MAFNFDKFLDFMITEKLANGEHSPEFLKGINYLCSRQDDAQRIYEFASAMEIEDAELVGILGEHLIQKWCKVKNQNEEIFKNGFAEDKDYDFDVDHAIALENNAQKLLQLNYLFARDINNADILAHEVVILKSNDPKLIEEYAKNVLDIPVKEIKKQPQNDKKQPKELRQTMCKNQRQA